MSRDPTPTCLDGGANPTGENIHERNDIDFVPVLLAVSQLSAQDALWEKTAGPPGLRVSVIYETSYAGSMAPVLAWLRSTTAEARSIFQPRHFCCKSEGAASGEVTKAVVVALL